MAISYLLDIHMLPCQGVVMIQCVAQIWIQSKKKNRRRDRNGVCQVYHSDRVASLLALIINQIFYFSRSFKFSHIMILFESPYQDWPKSIRPNPIQTHKNTPKDESIAPMISSQVQPNFKVNKLMDASYLNRCWTWTSPVLVTFT